MQCVFYDVAPLVKSGMGVFIQGSMVDDHLLFQLFWTANTLEIIQLGISSKKRRNRLSTRWFHEIMQACEYYRFRVIAKNVENSIVASKLQEYGFKPLDRGDYSFPF